MLNDHCPRIHAQHQQALVNADMEQLSTSAQPLFYMVYIIALALLINMAHAYIVHYNALVTVNDAMANCMNGHVISLGDGELKCDVREYKQLVSGLAAGGQL